MTADGRTTHHLWAASVVLALAPALLCGAQKPPEALPDRANLVTIDATDASVPELIRMLSQAAGANIVLAAEPDANVSLDLRVASLEQALNAICDASGLRWENVGGTFVVKPGNVAVQVVGGPAPESWRTWDGQLSEGVATLEFVPIRTKVADGRLTGTLSDVVDDLKAAGVDISIDPSATVGLAETALELGWHGERNTVEHVLLRVAMAARAEPAGFPLPPFTVLQHVDQEQHATDRLRVVPGDRWTDAASLFDRFGQYYRARRVAVTPPVVVGGPGWQRDADVLREYATVLQAAPPALQAKIDLELADVSLSDALKAIEAKLGKPITLAEGVKADTKVTVHAREAPILEVLTGILRPVGLTVTYAQGEQFDGVTVVPQAPWLNQNLYFTRPAR